MNKILAFFDGRKTYILGIITVALGIFYENMEMIMVGLISMGLRAGVTGDIKKFK